ncbi:MAG TPA: hypothetical protein ACHBX0_06020 [Arsenophonus sp.]
MGIFYGDIAQVIAGIFEFKKEIHLQQQHSLLMAFLWLSLVGLLMLPEIALVQVTQLIFWPFT